MDAKLKTRLKFRLRDMLMRYANTREKIYKRGYRKMSHMTAISNIRFKVEWYTNKTFEQHCRMVVQLHKDLECIKPESYELPNQKRLYEEIKGLIDYCQKQHRPIQTTMKYE